MASAENIGNLYIPGHDYGNLVAVFGGYFPTSQPSVQPSIRLGRNAPAGDIALIYGTGTTGSPRAVFVDTSGVLYLGGDNTVVYKGSNTGANLSSLLVVVAAR